MKSRLSYHLLTSLLSLFLLTPPLAAQDSTFTYSGSLNSQGAPANGSFDMQFGLYTDPTTGTQVGTTTTLSSTVTDGVFAVTLDFGPQAFPGHSRWIEMAVKGSEDATFSPLTPRTEIAPAPHARFAIRANHADTATTATYAQSADRSSMSDAAETADLATTASFALETSHAATADMAQTASSADHALHADTASSATYAQSADRSSMSDAAETADLATTASFALETFHAATADTAQIANSTDHALHADTATTSTFAANAALLDGKTPSEMQGFRWHATNSPLVATQGNNGYLSTSAGNVDFLLPPSPEPGDIFRFNIRNNNKTYRFTQNAGQQIEMPYTTVVSALMRLEFMMRGRR